MAWVGDSTVTFITFALAELARPEPACVLMIVANTWPFCSSVIRFATGVLPLKNATQLASIADCAAEPPVEPVDVDGLGDMVATGLDDEGVELAGGVDLPLLPQAATAMPTDAPRAGSRRK